MSPLPAWPTRKHLSTHFVQFSSVQRIDAVIMISGGRLIAGWVDGYWMGCHWRAVLSVPRDTITVEP